LLELWKKESGKAEGSHEFERLEQRELVFLDSILTSPLHRQSKSPTLWHHRFWLISLSLPLVHTITDEVSYSGFFKDELEAVFKAGEHHPKNYYAWQYARRLLVRAEELIKDAPENRKFYEEVKSSWIKGVTTWCRKHPSDISGWSFLLSLLPRVDKVSERLAIVKGVMDYAIKFELRNHSLWVFVRTALANGVLQGEQHALVDSLQIYEQGTKGNKKPISANLDMKRSITTAIRWIETNSVPMT
jgi:hypothetical protein